MENIRVVSSGRLFAGGKEYRCALGSGGTGFEKTEGDKKTPLGTFPIREVFFRADRIPEIRTGLRNRALRPSDGWCDDPESKFYNQSIIIPCGDRHENLWREDHVYDVIVVLGYNDNPPVPGKGSCIFMHVAREGYTPTDGCVALAKEDLLEILPLLSPGSEISINE